MGAEVSVYARQAADRLAAHVNAATDWDDPYRTGSPHDPEMGHTFDSDRFAADLRAVVSAFLMIVTEIKGATDERVLARLD